MTGPAEPERVEPMPAVQPFRTPAARPAAPKRENPVTGWARAIALGIRDTAHDMIDEGRRAAKDAQAEGWRKYDQKTKKRPKR